MSFGEVLIGVLFSGMMFYVVRRLSKGEGEDPVRLTAALEVVPDLEVTGQMVISALGTYVMTDRRMASSRHIGPSLEMDLAQFLLSRFRSVEFPYSSGVSRRGDIDVGKGRVGIDLNAAPQMKERAYCDALRLRLQACAEHYGGSSQVVLVVVGEEVDRGHPRLVEMEGFCHERGFGFVYIADGRPRL